MSRYRAACEAMDAHYPCSVCDGANGKEEMCPEGRLRYLRVLATLGDGCPPGAVPQEEADDTPTVCAHCLRAVAECGCAKGETR